MIPFFSLFALLPAFAASSPILNARDNAPAGFCSGAPNPIDNSAASNYAVIMSQNDPGICKGFEDNLHGQCGDGITAYNCNASPTGQMNVTFTVPVTCQGSSIQNAIWLASVPHISGVGCAWPDHEGPSAGEGLETLFESLISGAAALFGGESGTGSWTD